MKRKLSSYLRIKNIPNFLSIFRLILTIPVIIFLELDYLKVVWIIILVGGLLDYLDGLIARKFKFESKFGAAIDPFSDKILIIIPLIWLCIKQIIPYWSLSIIVIREFILVGFRKSRKDSLPSSKLAKLKTLFLFISLSLLFAPYQNTNVLIIGVIFYWLGFSLTIITLVNYLLKE